MTYHVAVVAVAVAAPAYHVAVGVSLFAVAFLIDAPFLDFVASLAAVAFLVFELLLVVVFHDAALSHVEAVDVQV